MFLFALLSIAFASQPTKRAKDFDRGGKLYQQNCWMCHGKMGEGGGPAAAALQVESPALAKRFDASDDHAMIQIILHGDGAMPAFSSTFGYEDAKRILLWLENPKPVKDRKSKSKKDKKKKKPKSKATKNRK